MTSDMIRISGFKFAEITISEDYCSTLTYRYLCTNHGLLFSEASLATLIPTFDFGLTDKPIVWKQAQVSYSTMGADSTKPEMIVKMGLVQAGGSSS